MRWPRAIAASRAGEPGVRHAIDILSQEILRNMTLLGLNRLDEVRDGRVVRLGNGLAPASPAHL